MQVQNFECQIAKAQIGRYLAGERLSDDLVQDLEAHIAKCPDCKADLAERRATLQAMLAPPEPAPEPPKAGFGLGSLVRSKLAAKKPVEAVVSQEVVKPSSFTKPALYSAALGLVLIGMSYAGKNMGSVLGPSADKVGAADPAPVTTVATPVVKSPQPPAIENPRPAFDKAAATAKASREATQPADFQPSEPKAPRHHPRNTIRVYAPE